MTLLCLLTLLPILAILLLLVWRNMAPHITGLIGWLLCAGIAYGFFHTSVEVCARASIAGLLSSFPITLMVIASIFQISYMESTGALKRITVLLKTLVPSNTAAQVMMVNLGSGTLLVSAGATPVSVLPPIMKGMGYSNFVSIALPALGFDALCTYSMLGAPLVTYSDFTGVPLIKAAQVFSVYLPVISTCIAFAMLGLLGGAKMVKQGFIPALLAGVTIGSAAVAVAYTPLLNSGVVLTGVIAGFITILVMILYLKLIGQPIIDRSHLTEDDLQIESEMSLLTAFSPWIILVTSLLIVNFCPSIYHYLYYNLEMGVSVIPGQVIKIRPFWNAYTWVFISTIVSMIFLKPRNNSIKETLTAWLNRIPKPVISTGVFFMLGLLMNNTGLENVGGIWKVVDPNHNMISVLAASSSAVFGQLYPLITAPLGLFGGFISGSEASALAMFAKYNIITSGILKFDPLVVTAATGIGAGLASVCSPAKLQNAAAVIDAIGEENNVIKKAFPISVLLVVAAAVMCYLLA